MSDTLGIKSSIFKDWCYACKYCVDDPDEIPDEFFDEYLVLSEYHDHVIYCKKYKELEYADNHMWTDMRSSCQSFEKK